LSLAERAEPELDRIQHVVWIERLERDHDNLRNALQWLLDQAMVEEAHKFGAAMWLFWTFHGHVGEGRAWLAKILAQPGGDSAAARIRVLRGAGQLAVAQSDTAAALCLHEEELALARQRGDRAGIVSALMCLGDTARQRGDYPRAHSLLEEALTGARALGDRELEAATTGALGILADAEGDFVTACSLDEAVLRILRSNAAAGSERTMTRTLRNLGRARHRLGDYAAARSLLEEALARARADDATTSIAATLLVQGELALDEGELAQARNLLLESIGLYLELGDRQRIVRAVEALAKLEAVQTRPELALRLGAAAAMQRDALQVRATPVEAGELEHWLDRSRVAVSPAKAEAAWAAGRTLPLEQIVADASRGPFLPTEVGDDGVGDLMGRAAAAEVGGEGAGGGGLLDGAHDL
jgi:tetratricopeptide (TPR) repeat protein